MEHLLTIDQQRKNCCPIDFDVIGFTGFLTSALNSNESIVVFFILIWTQLLTQSNVKKKQTLSVILITFVWSVFLCVCACLQTFNS